MGKCKHHPQFAVPGEGICPSCLQKKLSSVWRGKSHSDVAVTSLATKEAASGTTAKHPDSLRPKEAIAILGSIASITKRRHSKQAALAKGRDITEAGMDFVLDSRYTDGVTSFRRPSTMYHSFDARANFPCPETFSRNADSTMKDGAKRRSKVSTFVNKKVVGKSLALADAKSALNSFAGARSVGCRSLPLVDRVAKETALRVIREVGDDLSEGDGVLLENMKEQETMTCFSPSHWQSRLRSKWGLKGLGSPKASSNKVFPSKSVETVQKVLQVHFSPQREDSRFVSAGDVDRRSTLQQASDPKPPQVKAPTRESESSDIVIEGMPDRILKPEDMNQRLRTSYNTVLQWLQDLPIPETPLGQNIGEAEDPYMSSSFVMEIRNNDIYPEDLAIVGHLHEIAEEHENFDESSVEEVPTGNHLRDVSSFGKFLIRAAQRKPREGLSRVASAR